MSIEHPGAPGTEREAAGALRRLLTVGGLCAALVGADALVVAPLAPAITRSAHVSADLAGLLVATYSLVYAVTGTLFGPVSDRWGRRNIIVAGLMVFTAGTALTGLAPDFAVLLACRAVAGLGASMMVPAIFAAVADVVAPERMGQAIGVIMACLTGSSLAGVPLGALATDVLGWRATFWAIAGLAMLAAIAAPLALPHVPRAAPAPRASPLRAYAGQFRTAFFSRGAAAFLLLGTFLWTAGNQGMWANVGVYYSANFGLPTAWIGLVLFIISAVGVSGTYLGGRLADRYSQQQRAIVAITGLIIAITVLGFAALTRALVPSIAAAAAWVLAFNIGVSTITTLAGGLNPAARGTVLAMNSSALYAGATAGTSASAAILSATHSFLWVGALTATCCLLVFPSLLLGRERGPGMPGTATPAIPAESPTTE